jgi:hypothetical protein
MPVHTYKSDFVHHDTHGLAFRGSDTTKDVWLDHSKCMVRRSSPIIRLDGFCVSF